MSVFWEIVASNALLVAVLAVVLTVLGRYWKHPASLHVLWVLVLLKLFLPPVYTAGIPVPAKSETRAESSVQAEPAVHSADGELPWSVTHGSPSRKTEATPASPPTAAAPVVPPWRPSCPMVLLAAWATGSLLLAAFCWRRVRALRRLLRAAQEPSGKLLETARCLGKRIGLRRTPQILTLPVRLSPMVWSFGGRARIILPAHLVEQLDQPGREAILAHELAHIRRGDHVVRWVELTAMVGFWWHPAVWWARRQLRELEEQCCDGMVLDALPESAKSYAVSLVETLNFLSETSFLKPVAATGARPGASLKRRIAMLGDPRRSVVRLTLGRTLLLMAVAAVPMTFALAAQPAKQDKKPEERLPTVVFPTAAEKVDVVEGSAGKPRRRPDQHAVEASPASPPSVPPPISAEASTEVSGIVLDQLELKDRAAKSSPRHYVQTANGSSEPVYQQASPMPALPTFESRPVMGSPTVVATYAAAPSNRQQPMQPRKRAIFRLKNAPAIDVAETIRALYEGEVQAAPGTAASGVVISPDAVSNCILVSGSEEDITQIEEFIQTLDAPSSMVRVELLIAEVNAPDSEDKAADIRKRLLGLGKSGGIDSEEFAKELAELREQGALTVLSRPQIMTLDNQPATVQIGEALIGKPGDGPEPGVTVALTPRVADETVTMEIDVKIVRAEAGGQAVVATGGENSEGTKLAVQRLVTTTAQTTVSVADGRTAILGGLVPDAEAKDEQLIVVLTPHIVSQGPNPAVARSRRTVPGYRTSLPTVDPVPVVPGP